LQTRYVQGLAAIVAAGLFSGCTSGQSAIEPGFTSFNLSSLKPQLAIGTANIGTATGQFVGLNTVVTFRQPNGLSGTLVNTPSILGPVGFTVPATSQAGGDAGTSSITATPQTAPGAPTASTTFGQRGAAYGYGLAPVNVGTGAGATFAQYLLPFYAKATGGGFPGLMDAAGNAVDDRVMYVGGPPAFPATQNGTFPSGFNGYNEGFTDFAAAPASGSYTLSVLVGTAPGSSQASQTFTSTASLNAAQVLGAFATPTVTLDGNGGASVIVALPAGVTEAFVQIVNQTGSCHSPAGPQYFTLRFTASGTQALPANLGATSGGAAATKSICSGDDYVVAAAGVDYPAFGAAYPANTSQLPTLLGGSGQADVTTSYPAVFTAP
jgi:hypothetical protein